MTRVIHSGYPFLLKLFYGDLILTQDKSLWIFYLVQLHFIIKLSQLMMKCDIAISARGTTLYETCACGLFTICFGIADNQLMGIEAFAEKGLMYTVGDLRKNIEYGVQKIAKQM